MSKFYENYWSGDNDQLSDFNIKWPVLKKFIPKEEGKTILDFGCGKAAVLKEMEILNPKAKYFGVDISETALKRAKNNFPSAVFYKVADGEKIPIIDKSVDFVFSSEVLEHIYDVENALSELQRILKQEGKILLTVPYHGFIKNILITIFAFNKHFDPAGSHINFFLKKRFSSCWRNLVLKL